MRKKFLFIFTLVTVVALMAIIQLNTSAQPLNSSTQCLLNGVEVPGDPELIEGTNDADVIDCSTSPYRHDIIGTTFMVTAAAIPSMVATTTTSSLVVVVTIQYMAG